MADAERRKIQSMLQCPVCQEELRQPRVLPCQHTFCCTCLDQYVRHQTKTAHLPCPVCRNNFSIPNGGVYNLPKNIFVNNLLDAADEDASGSTGGTPAWDLTQLCSVDQNECSKPAIVFCTNCEEYMCQQCEKPHQLGKYTKKHKTVKVKPQKNPDVGVIPQCPKHTHKCLDKFCENCNMSVCSSCITLDHQNHNCRALASDTGSDSRLNDVLEKIDSYVQTTRQTIHETQQQSNQVKHDVQAMKHNTSTSYQAIHQYIHEQEQKHLADIDKAFVQTNRTIATTLEQQHMTLEELSKLQDYGQQLKKQGTSSNNIISLVKSYNQESSKPLPTLSCEVDVTWKTWKAEKDTFGEVALLVNDGKSTGLKIQETQR